MKSRHCRDCGLTIRIAVLPSGARLPVNDDPDPNGRLVMTTLTAGSDHIEARHVKKGERLPAHAPRYTPHFDTCSQRQKATAS